MWSEMNDIMRKIEIKGESKVERLFFVFVCFKRETLSTVQTLRKGQSECAGSALSTAGHPAVRRQAGRLDRALPICSCWTEHILNLHTHNTYRWSTFYSNYFYYPSTWVTYFQNLKTNSLRYKFFMNLSNSLNITKRIWRKNNQIKLTGIAMGYCCGM